MIVRRMVFLAAGIAVAVGLVVSGAIAGAPHSASIEENNANCGDPTGARAMGYATLKRKNPARDATYGLYLYEDAPANCTPLGGSIGSLLTNSPRKAKGTFTYGGSLAGITSVFVDLTNIGNNESLHVPIP